MLVLKSYCVGTEGVNVLVLKELMCVWLLIHVSYDWNDGCVVHTSSVCVCVCACARVRVCVCVCVCGCGCRRLWHYPAMQNNCGRYVVQITWVGAVCVCVHGVFAGLITAAFSFIPSLNSPVYLVCDALLRCFGCFVLYT